jgi:serpin B
MLRTTALILVLATAPAVAKDNTMTPAANAINALGLELLPRAAQPNQNALLSPYSIQSALAMAYAGADGVTRAEMAGVLHYPKDDAELHGSFAALRKALDEAVRTSVQQAAQAKRWGATNDPITLAVANRLFGQTGYDFREPFLALVRDNYGAPFEPLDFIKDATGATRHINGWVEDQTRQRIRNLIPGGALNALTRLVLVNAIYLKAPWMEPFETSATKPGSFHVNGGKSVDVPMMRQRHEFAYSKRNGFCVLALPYSRYELVFLIVLPDKANGLAALESKLTADVFATPDMSEGKHKWEKRDVTLTLPRFKLEPPVFALGAALQGLGMKTAFDQPPRSANFDRIAPRRPDDYLKISEVFHKTFLDLDEKGTEAAAATALVFVTAGHHEPAKPVEVRVDHPFLFAIQHRASGTCLFLGRVVDPR